MKRPMIQIRHARRQDFLQVAALDRGAWLNSRHGRFIPDGEHVWRIWCEYGLTFVASRRGTIIGAILAFPTVNQAYCLHKVMVATGSRGQGVGGKLMQAMLRAIDRRKADVFLTVDPSNESALRLYKKWGFTSRRLVRGFYRKNEDRYVLTRRSR